MTSSTALFFTAPSRVETRAVALPAPGPGQVLVRALVSAISAGTELLAYRGLLPADLPLDATIAGMEEGAHYPFAYGYTFVGEVDSLGAGVDPAWRGRQVFAFAPHTTHILAEPAQLLTLPAGVTPDMAAFLPGMETALSLVMDGSPIPGERVVVFGQGVVGLLVTALIARIPGLTVITADQHAARRHASQRRGAAASMAPTDRAGLSAHLGPAGADLVYELSGNPSALNDAIAAAGFGARVVIGSWYGRKQAPVDLGGAFHRSHMRLISSQVSHLAPRWQARWTKARRLTVAWQLLEILDPTDLISHRFPLAEAHDAYTLLDERPAEALQVLFDYRQ